MEILFLFFSFANAEKIKIAIEMLWHLFLLEVEGLKKKAAH
jgi:hypothetical protein